MNDDADPISVFTCSIIRLLLRGLFIHMKKVVRNVKQVKKYHAEKLNSHRPAAATAAPERQKVIRLLGLKCLRSLVQTKAPNMAPNALNANKILNFVSPKPFMPM